LVINTSMDQDVFYILIKSESYVKGLKPTIKIYVRFIKRHETKPLRIT